MGSSSSRSLNKSSLFAEKKDRASLSAQATHPKPQFETRSYLMGLSPIRIESQPLLKSAFRRRLCDNAIRPKRALNVVRGVTSASMTSLEDDRAFSVLRNGWCCPSLTGFLELEAGRPHTLLAHKNKRVRYMIARICGIWAYWRDF